MKKAAPPIFDEAYADRLQEAIMTAIVDASMQDIDGHRVAVIKNLELFDVLAAVMCMFALQPGTGHPERPRDLKRLFERRVDSAFRHAQATRPRPH